MANPRTLNTEEEEDPDILALRAVALSTLISKQKKEVEHIQQGQSQLMQPAYGPYQHHDRHHSLNYPQQMNGSSHYGGMRPEFPRIHFSPMDPHPRMMQQMGPSSFVPHRPFLPVRPPMMPLVLPHVNPNFVTQSNAPMFQIEEDMPILPLLEAGSFEPTPPSRLSPRSAMFVAKNEEALRRQKTRRRSSSSDRSRSRSPYKYRPRSRSPHQKLQHIVRKRSRSKSPVKDNGFKYNRRSRSPRRRSQEKRISPKYSDRRRFRERRDNIERKIARSPQKVGDEKRESDNEKKNDANSPSPAEVKKDEKREKTEQEIEDELLASSEDEVVKEVKIDDDVELKLTADANELDFLDDDEEESENEGRFKGKESSAPVRKAAVGGNFKSNFSYDRRDKPFNRHEHKREPRRDRRSRTPPRQSPKIRRRSPEPRKSPEVSRKTIKEPTKVIVINKKEEEPKKVKAAKPQPLFKSTFNLVEPQTNDKKKEEPSKKVEAKERVRLVRKSAVNRVEPLKQEKYDKKKEGKSEKAIMKRLGGYIKEAAPTKTVKPTWAKDQA